MSDEFRPGGPPVDTADELLVMPNRSAGRGGWFVLAALLVIGATLWLLNRPSPSPSASPPPSHLAGPGSADSVPTDPECRGIAHCVVRGAVPLAVARRVRLYLPPGVRLRARTVVALDSPDTFVAREIDAFVDSVSVLIRVERGGSGTATIAPDPPGVGSLLLHDVNSGYVVRLQYLAPDTVPPDLGRLRALIRDPRLTSA